MEFDFFVDCKENTIIARADLTWNYFQKGRNDCEIKIQI